MMTIARSVSITVLLLLACCTEQAQSLAREGAPGATKKVGTCDFSEYDPLVLSHPLVNAAIKKVEPEYSKVAKHAKAQGKVEVRILVDRVGDVKDACVVEGHPLLTPAAKRAAEKWKFEKNFGFSHKPNKRYIEASLFFTFRLQNQSDNNSQIQNLKDEQVIAALGSRDVEAAHEAVEAIVLRGDRMIPLLLGCKGNGRFFYGYGLGHRSSSFLIPVPAKDQRHNDGSFVTVEVAALYLISAIYQKNLEFASAPYLTDGQRVHWQKFNTPDRVRKAWVSVESWMQLLRRDGLEALRARQQSPLAASNVRFWAGN